MGQKKAKIRIIFKSGAVQEFECESLKVAKRNDNTICELEWSGLNPHPLYICLDNIAAVLEIIE